MTFLKILIGVVVVTTITFILIQNRSEEKKSESSGPIVFLGNSITVGVGAEAGEDFPTLVGHELGVEIINSGVTGDTTSDALARIDQDVISKNPSVVVVELGGNDFLQKVNFETTRQNFEEIISRLSKTGAKIVIVSVRTSPFSDKYIELERNLAKKHETTYMDNILKDIISDPKLMADSIHPNGTGYQKIAQRLSGVLKPMIE